MEVLEVVSLNKLKNKSFESSGSIINKSPRKVGLLASLRSKGSLSLTKLLKLKKAVKLTNSDVGRRICPRLLLTRELFLLLVGIVLLGTFGEGPKRVSSSLKNSNDRVVQNIKENYFETN